jgi:VWFA-related protein
LWIICDLRFAAKYYNRVRNMGRNMGYVVRPPVLAAAAFLATALLAFSAVCAQQEPVIKVSVNSVLVPVVVRDSQGRAIGGLNQSDFQLFDKSRSLRITSFTVERRAANASDAGLEAATSITAPTPPQVAANTSHRFIVFLFDDLHMAPEDLVPMKNAANRVVAETLRAGDSASVLSIMGRDDSGITTDRARLTEAIAKIQSFRSPYRLDPHACPYMDVMHADLVENRHDDRTLQNAIDETIVCAHLEPIMRQQAEAMVHTADDRVLSLGEQDIRLSYHYLRELVKRMAELPGERTVVYLSPGFYTEMPEALVLQSQVIEAAARANVTISTLDARGLYTVAPKADEEFGGNQKETRQRIRKHVESAINIDDVLSGLADATGGSYFHNSNNIEGGLRRLSAAPEYVYLLEFSLDGTKPDGEYHALKVKVDRDHVQVQNRRGYFAPKSEKLKTMMADTKATEPAPAIAPQQSAAAQTADVAPATPAQDSVPPAPISTTAETTTQPQSNSNPASADNSDSDSGPDAIAEAEARETGVPLPTNTAAPPLHEPAATHAAAAPGKAKPLYWNPPDLDPRKEDGVDASECELNDVLAQAATRATELVSNLQNFTAQEHVVYRVLGGGAEQVDSGTGDFGYNAALVRHKEGFRVSETRVPERGVRPMPAASRSIGLPEMALIFLPELQQNYEMHCGGAVLWQGQAAWLVTVRQRKDRPDHTATFSAANGNVYAAPLKGRAWIAQDSGEVIHLEIGLMHPVVPVGVNGWFLSIDYAPVKFRTRNVEVWLPQFAETYDDADYRRTIVSHEFSNFLLFSVDTKQETSSPASR